MKRLILLLLLLLTPILAEDEGLCFEEGAGLIILRFWPIFGEPSGVYAGLHKVDPDLILDGLVAVQASGDLKTWFHVDAFPVAPVENGLILINDPKVKTETRRFYRLVFL